MVAALPVSGAYAESVCLLQCEPVPVPPGPDAAEAVSLVPSYVTAYQMLHRLRASGDGRAATEGDGDEGIDDACRLVLRETL
jgi:NADPH:quinone reductase-like Zn-dependent oxidoreductase